jgi:hypothetical protein
MLGRPFVARAVVAALAVLGVLGGSAPAHAVDVDPTPSIGRWMTPGILVWRAPAVNAGDAPSDFTFTLNGSEIRDTVTVDSVATRWGTYECTAADVGVPLVATMNLRGVEILRNTAITFAAGECPPPQVAGTTTNRGGDGRVPNIDAWLQYDVTVYVARPVAIDVRLDGTTVATGTPSFMGAVSGRAHCSQFGTGVHQLTVFADGRPVPTTAATTLECQATATPSVAVSVKSVSRGNKVHVNVNPNKGSGYWSFKVQRQRSDGSWRTLAPTYRTRGKGETRTLNFGKGVYRVEVKPKFGYLGTTSASIVLTR